MVQSVELILDEESDVTIRAAWDRLLAAGLPSQARRSLANNRPHVTLIAFRTSDPAREAAIEAAVATHLARGMTLRLGGLVVFGRGTFVLARLVVTDPALLALQAAVFEAAGPQSAPTAFAAPGQWTPHITLAHRLAGDQLGDAVALVAAPESTVTVAGSRRWDGDERREWRIGNR